jgi:hypothetical protein
MAFAPASQKLANVSHAQEKFHKREALDQLLKKFMFHTVGQKDDLAKQSGLTVQWFRYLTFAANTATKAEGEVGTGIDMPSEVVTSTLSQYADFITLSDLSVDTLIDPSVSHAARNLGYRAGLSVDTIIRNVVDSVAASIDQVALGTNLTARDISNSVSTMQGNDVEPLDMGSFKVLASPFVTYDLIHDPTATGLISIFSPTSPDTVTRREDRGRLRAHVFGADIFESTNVTTLTGPLRYRTYVFGKGGLGIVSLAGRGPTFVTDPKRQRFGVRVIRNDGNQIADPEGIIAAAVSYNFVFSSVVLDTTNFRMRKIDVASSISS